MRYFISAGEASGDLHASQLIASLREQDPAADFTFLGGDRMAEEAGTPPLLHYHDMAFMGFSEVLRHLPRIFSNLATARQALEQKRPDALILVDYPDFNLKLARTAAGLGIPVYYYIPPKVWAWKEYRVKDLRRLCRRIFAIFPFEKVFYARHSMSDMVEYVGNPSVEEFDGQLGRTMAYEEFRTFHDLTTRPMLALVPGSRHGEVRNNLPVMAAVARHYRQLQGVVAAAPSIEMEFYRRYTTLPVVRGVTSDLMVHARAALVTSGTATLECALAGTPQVVCYRANGSRLSYTLMKRLLKVSHVSLPNLIAGRTIIPEMLLHHCNPAEVTAALDNILDGKPGRDAQLKGYADMRARLGESRASERAAARIVADLSR